MTDDITRRATSAQPVRLIPTANTDGGYDPRSTYCELTGSRVRFVEVVVLRI